MTVAVGARFKGGLILASESRLMGYPADPPRYLGVPDNDDYPKAFDLPRKRGAFAIAGELQLDVVLGGDTSPQLMIESTRLIRSTFVHTKTDCQTAATEAVRVINDAAKLVGCHGSLEILLGLQLNKAPKLWSISRRSTLGTDFDPVRKDSNPQILGIGEYHTYERFMTTPSGKLKPAEQQQVEHRAPPPLPTGEFKTRDEAEKWVRAVIAWCCEHSKTCGGPVVLKAYDS